METSMGIPEKISETLVRAGSTFRQDKIECYKNVINEEKNVLGKWAMETILDNAIVAAKDQSPLCDDTGIPHVFIELGKNRSLSGEILSEISEGIALGLERLPGRPMAICGTDTQRIDQSGGLSSSSSDVLPAPYLIKEVDEDIIRVHIIMQGGGPAIRGITWRVFHKHSIKVFLDEIVTRSTEAVTQLGCTPCTLVIGVGRSQYEAAALMMEAQVYGNYNVQSEMEQTITNRVNECGVGPLGLGGISVLATFMKVGPQRASGVRVVSIRPSCCFEPRIASVDL